MGQSGRCGVVQMASSAWAALAAIRQTTDVSVCRHLRALNKPALAILYALHALDVSVDNVFKLFLRSGSRLWVNLILQDMRSYVIQTHVAS